MEPNKLSGLNRLSISYFYFNEFKKCQNILEQIQKIDTTYWKGHVLRWYGIIAMELGL